MAWIEKTETLAVGVAERADKAVRRMTERSWAEVRGLFDHDCVSVNGSLCEDAGRIVSEGDVVQVRCDPHRKYHEKPRERRTIGFRIVHEDEHLLVVDKEARLLTVPTDRAKGTSLVDLVSEHLSRKGGRRRAHVVHRLDRGVSGLLAMAKNADVARRLQDAIRARTMKRTYLAVVAGIVDPADGRFESLLTTDASLNRKSLIDEEEAESEGELAITLYRTERRFRDASLMRIELLTGRRHQIRVHFAEASHPVLGDDRYRPHQAQHPWWKPGRLALHATRLEFPHPITQAPLAFDSPLPEAFQRFLDRPKS